MNHDLKARIPYQNYTNYTDSKRVLIVEDDPYWQLVLGSIVRNLGYNVTVRFVRTANQAERVLYSESKYDLVISDHYLQGEKSGLDLWKDVRRFNKNTPFMMISNIAEEKFLDLVENESSYPLFVSKENALENFGDLVSWHLESRKRATQPGSSILKVLAYLFIPLAVGAIGLTNRQSSPTVQIPSPKVEISSTTNQVIRSKTQAPAPVKIGTSKVRFQEIFTPQVLRKIEKVLEQSDKNIALVDKIN